MILNAFLALYRLAWVLLTPLVVIYFWKRGRRDPAYLQHLRERFGAYPTLPRSPVWIHAVSLGETRSAVPLARDLLAAGETVVFTHFTPTGRTEAQRVFAPEIAQGRVASVWVPLDMFWVYARFFRACRPKIGLTIEAEVWPTMVFAARRARVPLYMCNARYPSRSLARDGRGLRLRQRVMTGFAGAFVKSQRHADRFAVLGVRNIHVTGELRFDHTVPDRLRQATQTMHATIKGRRIITIASATEGEDDLYINMMQTILKRDPTTLFVYVPRAPERFGDVYDLLVTAGLPTARRSEEFNATFETAQTGQRWAHDTQVLLGDSLGEMYFYLELADKVVVGGGFTHAGAHNIVEPLALGKPVVTGPNTDPIEYPFVEAQMAGVARSVLNAAELVDDLIGDNWATADQIRAFMADHSGASARTVRAIQAALHARGGS